MLENTFQKQKSIERAKCIKCEKKDATGDDHLCDNCRFVQALKSIINNR